MSEQTEDKSSKTEEPTEKRLKDARKKGDVPSSRETSNMTGVFALFLLTAFLAPTVLPRLSGVLGGIFSLAGDVEIGSGRAGLHDLGAVVGVYGAAGTPLLATIAMVMVVAAIFGVLIQGETVVSLERLKPKLSNISPTSGLGRIYGGQALVEFLKSLTKLTVVCLIALIVTRRAVEGLVPGVAVLPEALPGYLRSAAGQMLIAVSCLLVPIALADILWKRFQWLKKNRMSQKEIRDEHKEAEGSPEIKRKRQEIRDAQTRSRLRTSVPGATVVLTNPTHYAVALRYDRGRDPAPVCVGKGVDAMAAQIRLLARAADVPVIENRALARALHADAELDKVIPDAHWQAVAQIVAYVLDLQKRIQRPPPPGSSVHVEH